MIRHSSLTLIVGAILLFAFPIPEVFAGPKKNRTAKKAKKAKSGRASGKTAKKIKPAKAKTPTAKALVDEAIMGRGMADFEGSMGKLTRALKLTKNPGMLARIRLYMGANFLDMDKKDEARAAFLGALDHDPTLEAPSDMKTAVRNMFAEIQKGARGTLAVQANLQARVSVDGKEVGKTPYEASVPIGSHLVQLESPRGTKKEQSVVVYPQRRVTVKMNLKQPRAREKTKKKGGGRIWTWVVGATAVAAAGAGLGVWLWADSDFSAWEEAKDGPAPDEAHLLDLEDGIRTKETAAYALFGTAGALAITSVVLFFLEPGLGGGEKPKAASASFWQRIKVEPVAGQTTGLRLRGSF